MFPQTEVGRSVDSAGVTHWGAGLPEALLGALLSHLDAPTLLRVARHVCREWRGACTEVLAQQRVLTWPPQWGSSLTNSGA